MLIEIRASVRTANTVPKTEITNKTKSSFNLVLQRFCSLSRFLDTVLNSFTCQ